MRKLVFDLVNGIRSGIPLCCTLFFAKHRFKYPDEALAIKMKNKRGSYGDSNYVMCDKCFKTNNAVEIKNNGVILKGLI